MQYEQVFALDSADVIRLLTDTLLASGCRVERSFDLRSAMSQSNKFPCPYHGAAACNCQFIILLVHASHDVASLTLHECEGFTRLRFDVSSAELQTCLHAAIGDMRYSLMVET